MSSPRNRPIATFEASRWRPLPVQPARSASRSTTSQPMLWRVPAYCEPGFPSPTTTFTRPPKTALQGPIPLREGPRRWYRGSVGGEELPLERAHRRLFGGFRMIPAADVERAVGRKETELVGRRPGDVAGLAAPSGLGLLRRALDGDRRCRRGAGAGRAAAGSRRPWRLPVACHPRGSGRRRAAGAGRTGRRSRPPCRDGSR